MRMWSCLGMCPVCHVHSAPCAAYVLLALPGLSPSRQSIIRCLRPCLGYMREDVSCNQSFAVLGPGLGTPCHALCTPLQVICYKHVFCPVTLTLILSSLSVYCALINCRPQRHHAVNPMCSHHQLMRICGPLDSLEGGHPCVGVRGDQWRCSM